MICEDGLLSLLSGNLVIWGRSLETFPFMFAELSAGKNGVLPSRIAGYYRDIRQPFAYFMLK